MEVLGAAVVAVGVAVVEAAGLCRVGGHGWAVRKGIGCMLQGCLVPNLEQRKAWQGWNLGEKNINSLMGRAGGVDPVTTSYTAGRLHSLLSTWELHRGQGEQAAG